MNITSRFRLTLSVRRFRSRLGFIPTSIPPTTPYRAMSELIGIIFGENLEKKIFQDLMFTSKVSKWTHFFSLAVSPWEPEVEVILVISCSLVSHL